MSILNFPRAAISYLPNDDAGDVVQFLLDGLPSGALLIDGKGKILMLNQQAENFLGWPAATLIGQPAHDWFDAFGEAYRQAEMSDCRTLEGEASHPGAVALCRGAVATLLEYRCSRYLQRRPRLNLVAMNHARAGVERICEFGIHSGAVSPPSSNSTRTPN